MKCSKCGADLPEGKLFCEVCGEESNIVPNAGELFDENYPTWARINLATSLDNVNA